MTLKEFDYYLETGIAKKVTPNLQRADFLIAESSNSMEGLNERVKIIGINDKNANSIIKDCYDILIELIRAKMFIDGYSSSGNSAHESEVAYLKMFKIENNKIYFMDELRHFRNSATYYGKILDKEYAEKVYKFTVKMRKELLSILI
ncbi:MAG: hypothetical protein ACP5N2_03505 [Candidatus Nanoarchaeia archaeon]